METDVYAEMRKKLAAHGYPADNLFGEKYYDEKIFELLEEESLNNDKGKSSVERFRDVVPDPNHLLMERCPYAGKLDEAPTFFITISVFIIAATTFIHSYPEN